MQVTCPCCAVRFPLEAGFSDDDGKRLAAVLADMEPPLARAAIAYLRLFKPAKTALRLPRAIKLLQDLTALVAAGTVCRDERNGVRRPAAPAVWVAAIEQMLQQSERLVLPLTGHGYLREVAFGIADKADAAAERERETIAREGRGGRRPSIPADGYALDRLAALSRINGDLELGLISPEEAERRRAEVRAA